MKIHIAGGTDKGKHRSSNEDAYGIFPDLKLAVVADGMGGHAAGEIPSRLAVETIHRVILSENDTEPAHHLTRAIQAANDHILEAAKHDPALSGMGTTVVSLLISEEVAHIGSVGDSRVYLYREAKLKQLTEDHSLVGDYIRKGLLSLEEAQRYPLRHVITRALGTHESLQVDLLSLPLQEEDIYLLCSDGLSNMIATEEIQNVLSKNRNDLEGTCKDLIDLANEKGGTDNITLVLLHCLSEQS